MDTILLVENEHAPRAVFGEYLGNKGFTVLEAADAAEALRACDAYSGQVDLLIADRKAGARLASRLAARYPGMGLLFIGDSERHRAPRNRHRGAGTAIFTNHSQRRCS